MRRVPAAKQKGRWKKWAAGAAAAAALAGVAEHKTYTGRELWLDHKAPIRRAAEHGGPLEKAIEKYGIVHDFGPKDATKTVYVVPQVHPQVNTLKSTEDAVRSQTDIHFILDELKKRGARFVYGEGVPTTPGREMQARKSLKGRSVGRKGWERSLRAMTDAGDVEGVRSFYRGIEPAMSYFVREKMAPLDFRLNSLREEYPYGYYLQDLYGQFSDVVRRGADPATGELKPGAREELDNIGRQIYVVNKYRSYGAADLMKEAANAGDSVCIMGGWHAKDILDRIRAKGYDQKDIRFRFVIPKSAQVDFQSPPPRISTYETPLSVRKTIEHSEPTAEDELAVKKGLTAKWEGLRDSIGDATGEDIGEWKAPE